MELKKKAKAFVAAVGSGDIDTIRTLVREDFIQHNPNVPTGREAFIGLNPILQEHGTKAEIIRTLQDGNFVIMHNHWTNAAPFGADDMVAFDILRFDEEGKIAEHWDSLMPNVTETASGRSLLDGPTEIANLDQTEANKALVNEFVHKVLIGHDRDAIMDFISAEKYDQHNPHVKDGLQGLFEAIQSGKLQFDIRKAHAIFAEGDFVLTVNEGVLNEVPSSFYDLFRIENGRITEHWDVTQDIPTEGMANENTLFNF